MNYFKENTYQVLLMRCDWSICIARDLNQRIRLGSVRDALQSGLMQNGAICHFDLIVLRCVLKLLEEKRKYLKPISIYRAHIVEHTAPDANFFSKNQEIFHNRKASG